MMYVLTLNVFGQLTVLEIKSSGLAQMNSLDFFTKTLPLAKIDILLEFKRFTEDDQSLMQQRFIFYKKNPS